MRKLVFLLLLSQALMVGFIGCQLQKDQTQSPQTQSPQTQQPQTQQSQDQSPNQLPDQSQNPSNNSNQTPDQAGKPENPAENPTIETSSQNEMAGVRKVFGPQISPDGQWLLYEKSQETDLPSPNQSTKKTHWLIARGLKGQADKTILTVDEFRAASFGPLPGKRFTSNWLPAGWSASGSKAYYVTSPETDGLGGFYPDLSFAAGELYEVDFATGTQKSISKVPGTFFIEDGIRDFDGAHQLLVLFDKPNVYLVDLKTIQKKLLFTVKDQDNSQNFGLSSALIEPTPTHVLLETYNLNNQTADYDYRLFLVSTGKTSIREITGLPKAWWHLFSWMNSTKTVKIEVLQPDGTYKVQSVVVL